jgi:hypothetical protein
MRARHNYDTSTKTAQHTSHNGQSCNVTDGESKGDRQLNYNTNSCSAMHCLSNSDSYKNLVVALVVLIVAAAVVMVVVVSVIVAVVAVVMGGG